MRATLSIETVINRCNDIINDIDQEREDIYEEGIKKLMNRRFFKKTREKAEKILKKREEDVDIWNSLPDWIYLYYGQRDHLSSLRKVCRVLEHDGKKEIELDDEDLRRLDFK